MEREAGGDGKKQARHLRKLPQLLNKAAGMWFKNTDTFQHMHVLLSYTCVNILTQCVTFQF